MGTNCCEGLAGDYPSTPLCIVTGVARMLSRLCTMLSCEGSTDAMLMLEPPSKAFTEQGAIYLCSVGLGSVLFLVVLPLLRWPPTGGCCCCSSPSCMVCWRAASSSSLCCSSETSLPQPSLPCSISNSLPLLPACQPLVLIAHSK